MNYQPRKLHIVYVRKDETQKVELVKHLASLKIENLIEEPSDSYQVVPGFNREEVISTYARKADLILLLLSAEFIYSLPGKAADLEVAFERYNRREVNLILILLKPCHWQIINQFTGIPCLPKNERPVTDLRWGRQDAALEEIVRALRGTIQPSRISAHSTSFNSRNVHGSTFAQQSNYTNKSLLKHVTKPSAINLGNLIIYGLYALEKLGSLVIIPLSAVWIFFELQGSRRQRTLHSLRKSFLSKKNKLKRFSEIIGILILLSPLAYNKVFHQQEKPAMAIILTDSSLDKRAISLANSGQQRKALEMYDSMIASSSNKQLYKQLYNNRAVVKKDLLDLQGAYNDYSRAIQIDPNFAYAYINRGEILRVVGRQQEALNDYRKAAAICRKQGNEKYYNRALLLIKNIEE